MNGSRLTDDELTALLAGHQEDERKCVECWQLWPCETVRLATEVRDLLKVARAIAKEPDELVSGAILEIARRYEEGGR